MLRRCSLDADDHQPVLRHSINKFLPLDDDGVDSGRHGGREGGKRHEGVGDLFGSALDRQRRYRLLHTGIMIAPLFEWLIGGCSFELSRPEEGKARQVALARERNQVATRGRATAKERRKEKK